MYLRITKCTPVIYHTITEMKGSSINNRMLSDNFYDYSNVHKVTYAHRFNGHYPGQPAG